MKKHDKAKTEKLGAALGSFAWSKQGKEKMLKHMKKIRANRWVGKTQEEKNAFCATLRAAKAAKSV